MKKKLAKAIKTFLEKHVNILKDLYNLLQFLLKDCQNDMKRTWQIMQKNTGKSKFNSNRFLKSINANGKAIKNSRNAEGFNKYFTTMGPNLASKIQRRLKIFQDFLHPIVKNAEWHHLVFEKIEKLLPETTLLVLMSWSKYLMKLLTHYL